MRKRGRWLLVAAVVSAVGLSYVVYSFFIHGGADYLTVSELKSQVESLHNQQVGVGGKVAAGSIDWDDKSKIIRFVLTDGRESLVVVYEGIVPDSFKPEAELVVVGNYGSDGVFEATSFDSRRSVCNLCH